MSKWILKNNFIWKVETTAANAHDRQVDLANEDEVRYGDKGYYGGKTKGYDCIHEKSNHGPSTSAFSIN